VSVKKEKRFCVKWPRQALSD